MSRPHYITSRLLTRLQVFDFKVDGQAENLLINGYALKLIPQRVQKMTFFAAVLPPGSPTLPDAQPGSVTSLELIEALNKLARTDLITADVDLSIAYEGDLRSVLLHVQVLELEGCTVSHKDLLDIKLQLPRIEGGTRHRPHHPRPSSQKTCESSDWLCRIGNWFHSLIKPHRSGCSGKGRGQGAGRHPDFKEGEHHNHSEYHRHRFHRPNHGFMRFIVHVVIPVTIGAAVGVGIGIVSVFIAEIVGGVLMRIRGRRAAEYHEIVDKDDEEFDEALPLYEEGEGAPAYTEEKQ